MDFIGLGAVIHSWFDELVFQNLSQSRYEEVEKLT